MRKQDITESHQRCSKCREWKPLHAYYIDKRFGKHRRDCKACINAQHRAWYARQTPEGVDAIFAKHNANSRKRNAERQRQLREEVTALIRLMEKQGYSRQKIQDMSGVNRRTIGEILRQETQYLHHRTVTKIRIAYQQMVTA